MTPATRPRGQHGNRLERSGRAVTNRHTPPRTIPRFYRGAMTPLAVAAALLALIALATVLGLAWRRGNGRVTTSVTAANAADLVPVLGTGATLLQFSTEVCAPCAATRRILADVAHTTPGIAHVDIDLTARPDLASRFAILQTPTTLVLDRSGTVRARIGGAPRRDAVIAHLDTLARA